MPLGLTASASATDGAIHKEMFGFDTTIFTISNEKNEWFHENIQIT